MKTSDDVIADAVHACVRAAIDKGKWTESHVSNFMYEHFGDGTAMMGVEHDDLMELADEGIANLDDTYEVTPMSSIRDVISTLATMGAKFLATQLCHNIYTINDLQEADSLALELPEEWDRIDELFCVPGEDGEYVSVWKSCIYEVKSRQFAFAANVTSWHPINNLMAMRVAVDGPDERAND